MRYLNGWHSFKSITFDQRVIQLSHVCNTYSGQANSLNFAATTGMRMRERSEHAATAAPHLIDE